MLLFGVIIVAGESFKIFGVNLPVLILVVIVWKIRSHLRSALSGYLWLTIPLLTFAIVGAFKYRFGDVLEDTLPLVAFLIIAVALELLDPKDRLNVCKFVIVFSALAVIKVLAINDFNIAPSWGGNGFWQGTKESVDGVNRIVLKGADVFIGTSTALLLINGTLKKGFPRFFRSRETLCIFAALTISIVFSLTRGTIVAIAAAFLFWILVGIRSGTLRSAGRFILVLLVCALITVGPLAPDASAYYQRFMNTFGLGQQTAEDDVAFAYRLVESANALDVARQTYFLGAGFGVSFFTPLSGSDKSDSRDLFVHSLPVWLILKVGIIGLVLVYGGLLSGLSVAVREIMLRRINPADIPFAIAAIGGLSYLLVNDTINNKLSTLSGGAAYALYYVLAKGCRVIERDAKGRSIAITADRD